jgi:hypothetical protein
MWVFMCMCVFMCVCVFVLMYVYAYASLCVYVCVHVCICVFVSLCVYVYVRVCICMCCLCLYVFLCIYSCMYICVFVFVISHLATACLLPMCNTAARICDICRDLFPVQTKHYTTRSDKQNSSDKPISNNQGGKRNNTGQILRIRVNLRNSVTNYTV